MLWRTMFCDTFLDVEAETEEEARERALVKLQASISADDFIVWATD